MEETNDEPSWKTTEDTHGVIEAFQAKNPHLITVKAP